MTWESTQLPSGLALAPDLAAQCILDEKRTVAFLRGTSGVIAAARERFPGETIEVVYAGTGPFAPFVVPLLPRSGVRFTLMDVDARSLRILSALLEQCGLREHAEIVHADATEYRHPTAIHVVVSETMQRSLAVEPFVAIARNLRSQLVPGGIFVPERVTVDVAMVDPDRERARWRGVDVATPYVRLARIVDTTTKLDPVIVSIPPTRTPQWLALLTEIDVFANERLRAYESGLTVPEILWRLSPARANDMIEFHYEEGAHPRIKATQRSDPRA
ncbi:MAG TPA: class I SAM-dependent methyltransferase [Thermoanaerobaculia bacterium]|nr:class I SAM-dependent methyltransferase [Thermoanaerobaculia bacterium]